MAAVTTAGRAVRTNPLRFLTSPWPWRVLAYLVTGAMLGPVLLVGLPLVALFTGLVGVPLVVLAVGALERRRLGLLGPVPPSPHRLPRPGLRSWLRLRYTEAATWRELAYAVLQSGTLWVVDAAAVASVAGLAYLAFVDPLLTGASVARWVGSAAMSLAIVVSIYLAAAVALGHGALARTLVGGETEHTVRELTRSQARLIDAFEVERRRIERDLHDGAQQHLVGLTMTLGLARVELDENPAAARDLVEQAAEAADAALGELRRLIRGIHPQVLTDHGLPAAIAELADRSPVPVTVELDGLERLPSIVESTAYFVVAEALTNAAKHARATSVRVTGSVVGDQLAVQIWDDGLGGANQAAGTGLAGVADRVAALDGRVTLSSPLGGPTVLRLELPCSGS